MVIQVDSSKVAQLLHHPTEAEEGARTAVIYKKRLSAFVKEPKKEGVKLRTGSTDTVQMTELAWPLILLFKHHVRNRSRDLQTPGPEPIDG